MTTFDVMEGIPGWTADAACADVVEVALSLDGPRELKLADGRTFRTQYIVNMDDAPMPA